MVLKRRKIKQIKLTQNEQQNKVLRLIILCKIKILYFNILL